MVSVLAKVFAIVSEPVAQSSDGPTNVSEKYTTRQVLGTEYAAESTNAANYKNVVYSSRTGDRREHEVVFQQAGKLKSP